jgi:hypothetical protein
MAIGSCRRCRGRGGGGRRGTVEPLCEECYRRAMDKVARELAEEAATGGRTRLRKLRLSRGVRPADRAPERVAPAARPVARPLAGAAGSRRPARGREIAAGARTRCISDELLREARRLYRLGLSLRAVAETLLDQTGYANAHSAEVALRYQFRRRGWPLRSRRQAAATRRGGRAEASASGDQVGRPGSQRNVSTRRSDGVASERSGRL